MASGINATFRQVGIAAGSLRWGRSSRARVRDAVISQLDATPLTHTAHALAHAISTGQAAQAIASAPPAARGQLAAASAGSFASALDEILLIGAMLAFAGGVNALSLIRQKDFIDTTRGELAELPAGAAATSEASLAACVGDLALPLHSAARTQCGRNVTSRHAASSSPRRSQTGED